MSFPPPDEIDLQTARTRRVRFWIKVLLLVCGLSVAGVVIGNVIGYAGAIRALSAVAVISGVLLVPLMLRPKRREDQYGPPRAGRGL